MSFKLLSRDDFREGVFARDRHKCVICQAPAVDSHHILERRLFSDGGYYLKNGVSVCEQHHLEAERTTLSCDALRKAAGIKDVLLPEHLTEGDYDKWGNPILPNGTRLRGDLFYEEPVQKVLTEGNVLSLFTKYVKFPRTFHLPWSPGMTSDDRMMESPDPFKDKHVVITLKMDGENTTLYRDFIHARSLSYDAHPSHSMIKARHASIAHDIPDGWRVCAENCVARHSISYENLEDYLLVFQVWNDKNVCLSWEETVEWTDLIGLSRVPVIYTGAGDRSAIWNLHQEYRDGDPCEGYVVRESGSFAYSQYRKAVGKYVRPHHVQTDKHWKQQEMVMNGIRSKTCPEQR